MYVFTVFKNENTKAKKNDNEIIENTGVKN